MLWPTPYPMTTALQLGAGESRISLPVVPYAERPVPQFVPPVKSPTMPGFATLDAGTSSGYGEISWSTAIRRPATSAITATNSGGQRYPWGVERYHETIEHRVTDGAPDEGGAAGHASHGSLTCRAASWSGRRSSPSRSDRESFHYDYRRRLTENGKLLREKSWHDDIPRDFQ